MNLNLTWMCQKRSGVDTGQRNELLNCPVLQITGNDSRVSRAAMTRTGQGYSLLDLPVAIFWTLVANASTQPMTSKF